MSSSIIQLPDVLEVDSRLTVSSQKKLVIRKGSANNMVNKTSSQSVSNASISFNVVLDSAPNTIYDPYMYVEVPFTAVVSATGLTSGTVQTYLTDNFSFRQYPLASVMNNASIMFNGTQVQSNPNVFIHQLSSFQDFLGEGGAILQSICPIMPDQAPQYSTLVGSQKSPLLSYTAGGEHYSEPRGSFNNLWTTATATTGTWSFSGTIREPIFIPCLDYYMKEGREGFLYVNKLQLILQFSNISRIFSLDATTCPAITGIDVTFNSATLYQYQLSLPNIMIRPPLTVRSFNTLTYFESQIATAFAAGEQRTILSQSTTINQIPSKFFVWVGHSYSSLQDPAAYSLSDFAFSIQNCQVTYNGRNALLSNFNSVDLYNNCMAAEGCQFSYVQAEKFTGHVLAIDPVKLFGLQDDQAPGQGGQFQFLVQLQCTNISSAEVTASIYIVQASPTILTIDQNGVCNQNQNYVTAADVLEASKLNAVPSSFRESNIYGGSFWDDVKKFFGNIWSGLTGSKAISKGLAAAPHPIAQALAPVAQAIGLGGQRTSRAQLRAQAANALRF